jgi:catechol 2,3-dioxygenase-like lactoylglutathione lyase family enzyme
VIDHVDLVVSDLERSLRFYHGLLEPLGWTRQTEITGERGERVVYLGREDDNAAIGLRAAQSPRDHDRYAIGLHHLCLRAASREQVDERAAWATENGAIAESGPREYDYSPGYYAAFFAAPDGIKLEVVHS